VVAVKALTVRQPHAQLIALGIKTIETRSWATKYRGPLVIHAGLSTDWFPDGYAGWYLGDYSPLNLDVELAMRLGPRLPLGAPDGQGSFRRWHCKVCDRGHTGPIPAKGRQGLWTWEPGAA
jgi:hypothetical protein